MPTLPSSKWCKTNYAQNQGGGHPPPKNYVTNILQNIEGPPSLPKKCFTLNVTLVPATPPLYPTPQTQSSLAWDKLHNYSDHPLRSDRKSAPPRVTGLWPFFLLYPAGAFMVGPYANSSKLSYTTTLFLHHGHHPPKPGISSAITTGVLHSPAFWQEISSTKQANRPLACGLFYRIWPAP